MENSFGAISPDLVNNGYCVYAFNYDRTLPLTGIYATGDIAASARQLASEVSQVLNQTGASKVDMVGWSPLGTMPSNWYRPRHQPDLATWRPGRAQLAMHSHAPDRL